MKNTLLDFSTKIDPETKHILIEVLDTSKQLDIEFFVIGATARDIIIINLYGIKPVRATQDIDFGVMVNDWDQFNTLRDKLLNKKDFKPTNKIHRIIYKTTPIDIVPFGNIEKNNKIEWPPENNPIMNVVGFDVAYSNSFPVKISQDKVSQFISLHCLALLKLFAWEDRKSWTGKDADDFCLLLTNYTDFDNADRIYEEHADMLDDDFDYEMAGARLLGRDIAEIINEEISEPLMNIINNETGKQKRYLLVEKMYTLTRKKQHDFDWHLKMLEQFKQGILD